MKSIVITRGCCIIPKNLVLAKLLVSLSAGCAVAKIIVDARNHTARLRRFERYYCMWKESGWRGESST
jgi:hypothetical protein